MLSKKILTSVLMALAVLALAFVVLTYIPAGRVDAAPVAIPTPIAPAYSGDTTNIVTFFATKQITADTSSVSFELPQAEALDLQYTIDQTAIPATLEVNTTTLKLRFSNDGVNWTDGVNVVASNTADVTNLLQFNNFGRYTTVYADVAVANPITITVIGVARR